MARRVLVTDHVFADLETERSILEPLGAEVELADGTSEAELVEAAGDADAILVCFAKIPEAVVAAAAEGGCKIISRYGIGYDNIDIAAATERGILVTYVPDYCLDEVADHSMALLLALARGVHHAGLAVRAGDWTVPQGAVHRLRGRRLALIGVGGVGSRMAERARAFGIETVAFDPFIEDWSAIPAEPTDSFADAVAEADFISLHVPLTEENRHLIGAESIAGMNRAPIIVNTARGPLVDADAAAEALDCRQARRRRARRHRGGAAGAGSPAAEPPACDPHAPHGLLLGRGTGGAAASRGRGGRACVHGRAPDRPINPEVLSGS